MKDAALARWRAFAPRERSMVLAAAAVVALAFFWWVAIGPAVTTLRAAPEAHRVLDAQLQQMQRLEAQAKAMQSQPRQAHDEAMRQLEQVIRQQLGTTARYTIAGERVTLTLTGAQPSALSQFLSQVRINARALPGEAKLGRNAAGTWDGTLVLSLPPR